MALARHRCVARVAELKASNRYGVGRPVARANMVDHLAPVPYRPLSRNGFRFQPLPRTIGK